MVQDDSPSQYERVRKQWAALFENPEGAPIEILPLRESGDDSFGVKYADPYITVIRDRVRFLDGAVGGYVRIIHSAGIGGGATLPVCDEGVVLVRHFRHATRIWHWEIPRGFGEAGEMAAQTAERELWQELHKRPIGQMKKLGYMYADTGIAASRVELFWARIDPPAPGDMDSREGVTESRIVTESDINAMLVAEDGGDAIHDSFTLAAILLARQRGLLPPGP